MPLFLNLHNEVNANGIRLFFFFNIFIGVELLYNSVLASAYNKVNQLYIYIYPHISSPLGLPPSHPPYPTPLGGHRAPS